jgi:hypothetical protein
MATYAAKLTEVETAITSLISAISSDTMQEYQLPGGRMYKRAEFGSLLNALQKREEWLQEKIDAATAGGSVSRVRVVKFGGAGRSA